jgi:predicted amidophosphoribosyltransferase
MVRALKFGGRVGVANAMAAQIVARAPAFEGALVPVPAHARHRRRRGFDHARVLADAIARRTGAEVRDCLVRAGTSVPQVGRGRAARMAGLAGGVSVRDGVRVPEHVVVVDDVVTTGATLLACARTLREAGAERVTALVYAATEGR